MIVVYAVATAGGAACAADDAAAMLFFLRLCLLLLVWACAAWLRLLLLHDADWLVAAVVYVAVVRACVAIVARASIVAAARCQACGAHNLR